MDDGLWPVPTGWYSCCVTDIQTRVQRTVDRLVETGRDIGVQVAACLDGTPVVGACAGVADRRTGRPMTADTPVSSFSTGKGLTATAVHVLAEQGRLDYELRIADVWKEYATVDRRHPEPGLRRHRRRRPMEDLRAEIREALCPR